MIIYEVHNRRNSELFAIKEMAESYLDYFTAADGYSIVERIVINKPPNTTRGVILEAGNKWYDEAHGGSVDGFIAGAEWALNITDKE